MANLERAIALAATAHAGQVDKAGAPYILHPLRVMLAVSGAETQIVAVLHDVIEDTTITFDFLRKEGFSEVVLVALEALTKRPGESRLAAAERAVVNPLARLVKIADVSDNMNLKRLPQPSEKDFQRLAEYQKVLALLQAHA